MVNDFYYRLQIYAQKEVNKVMTEYLETTINSLDSMEMQNYQIYDVKYDKMLYSPCFAEVTLKDRTAGRMTLPDVSKFKTAVTTEKTVWKHVNLYRCYKDNNGKEVSLEIGNDYIIYQVRPVAVPEGGFIILTLYSRDKLLTLDRFCRVYVNQRLGQDIICGMLRQKVGSTDAGPLAKCNVKYDVTLDNLKLLSSTFSNLVKPEDKNETTKTVEHIQPYRVQYNEDFHSFISRIACRCGEFLFFEDGKLRLGLDFAVKVKEDKNLNKNTYAFSSKTAKIISLTSEQIKRIEQVENTNSELAVGSFFSTYQSTPGSADVLSVNEDIAFDEYFDKFVKTELPDTFSKEFAIKNVLTIVKDTFFPHLGFAFNKDYWPSGWSGVLINLAKDLLLKLTSADRAKQDVNNKFVKDVFENSGKNSPNFQGFQQLKNGNLTQFSNLEPGEILQHLFFKKVRDNERKAENNRLLLQVDPSLKIGLGDLVYLPGKANASDIPYVVTRVRGHFDVTASGHDVVTEIEIVSHVDKEKDTNKPIFYPPYNKCSEMPPVPSQTAIVGDVNDPRFLGRVRVRYPWQKDTTLSPWIRVLSPSASADKMIHFAPEENDEVMVSYIGGNIDRPYVSGSLFNKKTPLHKSLYMPSDSTIKVGSQKLDFKKGTYDEMFTDLIPGWDVLVGFAPELSDVMTKGLDNIGEMKKLKGNITLTDTVGIWSIKGDTAAREVTINSELGQIKLNAFTGITIKSEGDIKICGKNVKIEAANNLSLQSGCAIAEESKIKGDGKKQVGAVALGVLSDTFTKKMDLSLIRSIVDLVLPPKEGTLKLKSNRYLLLEAGEGSAMYADDGFKKHDAWSALATQLDTLKNAVTTYTATVNNLLHQNAASGPIASKKATLISKITNYNNAHQGGAQLTADNVFAGLVAYNGSDLSKWETYTNLNDNMDSTNELKDAITAFNDYKNQKTYYQSADKPFLPKYTGEVNGLANSCEAVIKGQSDDLSAWYSRAKLSDDEIKKIYRTVWKTYLTNHDKVTFNCNDIGNDWQTAVIAMTEKEESKNRIGKAVSAVGSFLKKQVMTVDENDWNPNKKGTILMSSDSGHTHVVGITNISNKNNPTGLLYIQRKLMESNDWVVPANNNNNLGN